ncbi:MAG: hypothetical protein ACAH06_09950 [Methylophilaceae bacterium]|jgi:hypothetical protein|uniref:hypothetical protein n=1 Tax=Methylobacillus sp. MM3 TaxID=1848039 RepID=UPI0009EE2699|nr:hypothetical protein [Methylobacillus sp. MM3]
MKNNMILKAAVLGALGLVSAQAMATGLVNLPSTGFAVGSDTSPYTLCNTTSNFGSGDATYPTTLANNTCAVFPANVNTAPEASFTLVTSVARNIVLNDATYTNGTNVTVGSVVDRIWRKSSTNECIYGAQITLTNTDYDLNTAGSQYLEVNDFVRAGFSGRTVNAGYFVNNSNQEDVVSRMGRTNVSVQHRADASDATGQTPASGYVAQPLTTPTPASTPINGVNAWPGSAPSASQQSAALDGNYVDFTIDANYLDDDRSKTPSSPYTYVKTSCSSSTHTATAGALTFRQTGQEQAPWISFSISGFVPN